MPDDTILVRISEDIDEEEFRDGKVRQIPVEELASNVRQFLAKIENMLGDTPETVAGFRVTEFEITAEISAEGKVSLLGSGVGVTAQGGLTFRFQRD